MKFIKSYKNKSYLYNRYRPNKEITWIGQPDDHTCGSTCIKMAIEYIGYNMPDVFSIQDRYSFEIKNMTGAPYFRLEQILKYNSINFTTLTDNGLKNIINILKNNVILLSVLINEGNNWSLHSGNNIYGSGYKHWVVVYDYDANNDLFFISDPWLGLYKISFANLINMSKPRNYLYMKIPIDCPFKTYKDCDDVYPIFKIINDNKMKIAFDVNFLFNLNICEYVNKSEICECVYSEKYFDGSFLMGKSINSDDRLYINILNNNVLNKMKKYCNLTINRLIL